MITAFFAAAYLNAISLTFSVGTPVICSTSAYFSTIFLRSSKPLVRFSMNSLFCLPSLMIQYIMELISAMWVDGLNWSQSSASLAVAEYLGSTTMMGIPFFFACTTRRAASGCASTALDPHMTIRSEFRTSSNGLVAAPEPNESESPATEGPWQIRAQLSMLLVLNAILAHFCMM